VRGQALLLPEVVSDVWSFTKEACTPFTMALLGPADGETLSDPPTFSWGVDGGTNNVYTVQWSDVPNFAWILGESPPLAIPAWNMPQADWDAIPVGEVTYWRVEGVSQDDPTCTPVYSAQVFSFTKQIVVPLTTITLQSPADGATLASPPTFSWGVDGGTDNAFAVDLSYSADFSSYWSTLGTGPIAGTSWPMPVQVWNQITAGQQVFWRVRGADLSITPLDVITSDQVWSFTKQP
jgi:hypothetical protein